MVWRYILTEKPDNPNKLPKMHLGMMLETWRALADLVQHSISDNKHPCQTVADYLEGYIMNGVFLDAQMDAEWQVVPKFNEIGVWLQHRGRVLVAGIDLFNHHALGTGDSIEASPLLRRVLLRAADKALGDPLPTHRRADIAMFHQRIRGGGLAWNAGQKSVRVVAQRQCICYQDETLIHPNLGAGAASPFLNSQATGGKAMPHLFRPRPTLDQGSDCGRGSAPPLSDARRTRTQAAALLLLKLEDARVGLISHFGKQQQVIATKLCVLFH